MMWKLSSISSKRNSTNCIWRLIKSLSISGWLHKTLIIRRFLFCWKRLCTIVISRCWKICWLLSTGMPRNGKIFPCLPKLTGSRHRPPVWGKRYGYSAIGWNGRWLCSNRFRWAVSSEELPVISTLIVLLIPISTGRHSGAGFWRSGWE